MEDQHNGIRLVKHKLHCQFTFIVRAEKCPKLENMVSTPERVFREKSLPELQLAANKIA